MIKLILIFSTIGCTVIGNLLLKIGVGRNGTFTIWPFTFINWHIIISISFFGMGLILYALLLKRLPLNIAQTIFSVQFIAVILASSFVLNEPISTVRWLGILFVAIGLAVVGWSSTID